MTRTAATVADLLTSSRVPWARVVAMGGDVAKIRDEALAHGDTVLAQRAARHLARA